MPPSSVAPRLAPPSFTAKQLPHDDLGPQLDFTIWLLTILALGFLGLRIYCKLWRSRRLWWDDYVLVAAWVALAVASAMTTWAAALGYGKHLWDINPKNFVMLNLTANVAGTASILAALWSKTSFAMTVLRISTGWMRWCIWFIVMSMNVVMGASAMFEWIKCVPIEKSYNPFVHGQCWPPLIVAYYFTFSSAYSGAMDIILAIFPWKIIWGMRMNKKEKIGVLFAMSMGIFAGTATLIKVFKVQTLDGPDPSNTVQLVICGVAEGAITIIAASIPILRALLKEGSADNSSADKEPSPKKIELEAD